MFISRELRIALLISFLWHLFWAFSVSIVFLPRNLVLRPHSSVYFLGSILRKPISIGPAPCLKREDFAEFPSEADIQRKSHFTQPLQSSRAGLSERAYTSLPIERKPLKYDGFIDVDGNRSKTKFAASFVSAKSPTTRRETIFQPPFPKYPEWTQPKLKGADVVFEIYISAEGIPEEIINVRSSGNPEIDVALARYIKRWRFAPVSGLQGQSEIIKVNLD